MAFNLIPAKEFFTRKLPNIEWTVRNLVEQGTFVVLGGEPKTSKTWASLELALSVASGRNAFNSPQFETKVRPVFMFLLEDGEWNVQARLQALASPKGMNTERLSQMPLHVSCRKPMSLDEDAERIISILLSYSEQEIRDTGESIPGLVLIDPLRNAHHREENDSGEMRKVMDACLEITRRTGYSLVVNHHFKKIPKNQEESPGYAMRGSSSIYGSVDGIIGLRKIDCGDKNIWQNNVACQVKAGPQARPFGLELRVEDGAQTGRAIHAEWVTSELY